METVKKLNLYRNGSILLGLIICIAIIAMLYMVNFRAIFGTNRIPASPEEVPWNQESLLIGPDELIELPKSPKPMLYDPLSLEAPVTRQEADRGTATVNFSDMGEVDGEWSCQYTHEKRGYAFSAKFKGNIVTDKTWHDETTKDKSRLFFIAKGKYLKQFTDKGAAGISEEIGTVYVTGWLTPDHNIKGAITITTDKTWSAVYNFDSK
jgi:hypothetical protein